MRVDSTCLVTFDLMLGGHPRHRLLLLTCLLSVRFSHSGRRGTVDMRRMGVGELGAALVEAAIVVPFLIVLALGIVESSWLLAHQIDVRGVAREGGRLAGTNDGDSTFIVSRACAGFDDASAVTVSLSGAAGALGDNVDFTVVNQVDTITGFFDWAFNPPVPLSSTSTFRIESLPVSWTDMIGQSCP